MSNVGPGFDLMGFALEAPGDEMIIRRNGTGTLVLVDESGCNLPLDPEKNVASVAARALLEDLDSKEGFDLVFTRKINPGSGVGSSAASCVAAVVGVNEILGCPFHTEALIPYAMEGEKLASGAIHADNIAPALLGGFTLIRGYDPLDIKHIPYPSDLWCAVVHPRSGNQDHGKQEANPRHDPYENRPAAMREPGRTGGRTGHRGLSPDQPVGDRCFRRALPHPAAARFRRSAQHCPGGRIHRNRTFRFRALCIQPLQGRRDGHSGGWSHEIPFHRAGILMPQSTYQKSAKRVAVFCKTKR